MFKSITQWLALIGLAFFIVGCSQDAPTKPMVVVEGATMGTYYRVKVVTEGISDVAQFQAELDKRLELVNDQMSTYRPQSELSLFNQAQQSHRVSADTIKVVKQGIELAHLTQGALDITLGPLVNLWGFGPDAKPKHLPTAQQIAERKAITGVEHLSFDGLILYKAIPELYVDLSSIAKGYGVDVLAEYIESLGEHHYLVDIGGELRMKGNNDKDLPWRIAVEKPVTTERAIQKVVVPGNNAVATSGNYRNYFEENGERFSHMIDPNTGMPIKHKLVSVTVIGPSSMVTDGLATAIMVMGPKLGYDFASEQKLAVYMIIKTDSGFVERYTQDFEPFLLTEAK
ncbi:FAD:protein FMN transferase [Motilimonas eburnea]|uniref:FAD:protein FMN transferase n=1 Tax=Motilimonas eburnea TaxID=1737488 RepID=UPI001E51604E|nr:FAD:protein FMN transferase [Motilimonas eburnea]MCE2569942.1 FAD:protein FMN transferase [Motilimonas eburnea]